jgi:hypothetical protein
MAPKKMIVWTVFIVAALLCYHEDRVNNQRQGINIEHDSISSSKSSLQKFYTIVTNRGIIDSMQKEKKSRPQKHNIT